MKNLIELLNTLDRWINETPPIEQPQRFGNKAFRNWFSILQEVSILSLEFLNFVHSE